ncbi:MAG: tetratricopeptide repeat protein [Acidobacteria bacterium]|nr:MAG: tetratricopeptide repeat protein [Acidobacteriota bacterium]
MRRSNPLPDMLGASRVHRREKVSLGAVCAAAVLTLVFLLLPSTSRAQQGKVLVESSEQLFCTLAALNAAGYNAGPESAARDAVNAYLAGKQVPVIPDIRTFYEAHKVVGDPGRNLGQYISLALLLGPPPDFKLTVAQADLPPDAKNAAGMVPLLKQFYQQADMANLWARAKVDFDSALERYSSPVRRSIELTDAYLRFPAGSYLGRTYIIYLNVLGAPNQVQARIYGSNYYLVVTPSERLRIRDIRHQYLHFLLDPLAVKYGPEIQHASALEAVARKAPALGSDFKSDFALLVTECLIRAAELRMDKAPAADANRQIEQLTASGLILVPYFYDALQQFEKQDASMSSYYQQMVQGISPAEEAIRLGKVKFSEPPPQAASAAGTTETERLLDEGDNDIYSGNYDGAKAAFEQALAKDPKSERALFGMAVVASNTRKPDLARQYFEQTLDAATDLRIVTWCHIYLGRLDDISGSRNKALAQYRTASLTAGRYPEAMRAVEAGLREPFGVEVSSSPGH